MSKINELKERVTLTEGTTLGLPDIRLMVAAAIEDKGEDHRASEGCGTMCHYYEQVDWRPVGVSGEVRYVPSCIFGHAFSYLGLTIDDLEEMDASGGDANSVNFAEIAVQAGWTVTDAALTFATLVQDYQDSGKTWGEARAKAEVMLQEQQERDRPANTNGGTA
jgi:hypothetical protein